MRAFHENRTYGKGLPVQMGRIRNISFLAHWHHDLEFMYVTEGSLQIGINYETRVLKAGDFAFCGSGDIHYYDSSRGESEIIMIIFNPRLIGSPAGWPVEQDFRSHFITSMDGMTVERQQALAQLAPVMQALDVEAQQAEPSEMIITGLLQLLCGLVERLIPVGSGEQKRQHRSTAHLKMMQELLDQLEQNCTQPLTLQDGADYARMSVFHFSRFFKNVTGMGYNTYVNELRIRRAEQQIVHTDERLLDIALDCGFGNIRTFNRVFRQLRGCKPSDLR
ncbi:helix-turn-helix transcriptional regulator [Paenibacillus kandeliae]|uniref:helix-turn-helix transcriptional regulator n=1 Tax=Paenibacillus kandeliae TaxID=3231269 RepID=UPI00345B17A4